MFSEIITNEDELRHIYSIDCESDTDTFGPLDNKGISLFEWLRDAQVGWDPMLKTYFIQCGETVIDDVDDVIQWHGKEVGELPTFQSLCHTITGLFCGEVDFKYVNCIEKT
jgi:hypothetical protein